MPWRPPLTVRSALALGAVGAGAVASARVLLRPRQETAADKRLLDWEAVRATAHARAGAARADAGDGAATAATCDAMAAELAPLMTEVCQRPLEHFPRFEVLDRHGFIDVNLDIARRLLVPVEEVRATMPDSLAAGLSRGVMNRYIGLLFGVLSQRVLGQFDPVISLGPRPDDREPALYLVEPNLEEFAAVADAPITPLRRWLILHELTHAWQFGEHPWLRDHLESMMEEMIRSTLSSAVPQAGQGRMSTRQLLDTLPGLVRTQLRGVATLQAVMSVLEGYANYVMHTVGRRHLEHFERLEEAFQRRRAQRTPLERAVLALTGINMKMRQYEAGERFCTDVVAAAGLETLNRVWEGPAMLPTPDELRTPKRWVQRVSG